MRAVQNSSVGPIVGCQLEGFWGVGCQHGLGLRCRSSFLRNIVEKISLFVVRYSLQFGIGRISNHWIGRNYQRILLVPCRQPKPSHPDYGTRSVGLALWGYEIRIEINIPSASIRRLSCTSSTHLRNTSRSILEDNEIDFTADPLSAKQRPVPGRSFYEVWHAFLKKLVSSIITNHLNVPVSDIPFTTLAFLCLIQLEDAVYSTGKCWVQALPSIFIRRPVQIAIGHWERFLRSLDDPLEARISTERYPSKKSLSDPAFHWIPLLDLWRGLNITVQTGKKTETSTQALDEPWREMRPIDALKSLERNTVA